VNRQREKAERLLISALRVPNAIRELDTSVSDTGLVDIFGVSPESIRKVDADIQTGV
jgi:hypothetical protein